MPFYYYGFDIYYLALILPAFIISLVAQIKVKSTFSKYSKVLNHSRLTGAMAAEKVLSAHGVYDVRVERVGGELTDHFDPTTKVIRLSDSVYDSYSVAAVGVAAHEAGHAVQYAEGYSPIKFRAALVPVVNFGSKFSFIALFLGLFLSSNLLIWAGIILFSFATLFHLVTLPVELNASKRAMETIKGSYLLGDEDEIKGARRVLTAAAMTYIAAVLMSIAQLIRLLAIFGRRRD
ncbi:MAG: zinc metallopeptidase [Acutalibacteraceae bacterium]|nr:zinc metallopeptidase [Acutalibacteraceae bacterium]